MNYQNIRIKNNNPKYNTIKLLNYALLFFYFFKIEYYYIIIILNFKKQ